MELREIDIADIRSNPVQPKQRTEKKVLAVLKREIETVGMLSPVVVTPDGNGFVLIDGHRRVAVHVMLGRKTIMAIINIDISDNVDAFRSAIVGTRAAGGVDQMNIYLRGGRVEPRIMTTIEFVEKRIGKQFVKYLMDHGKTTQYCHRAKSIAESCGFSTRQELRKFFVWSIRFNVFSELLVFEKMKLDTRPITEAVNENRPLKKKVSYN